ncbi:MAG: glycoside hydrolase family 13 protein [Acidobacteriota bacterium]
MYKLFLSLAIVVMMATFSVLGAKATIQGERMRRNNAYIYDARMADWRNHQVVYQVFVDRFALSGDAKKRAQLYAPPRRLRPWDSQPTQGSFLSEESVWSHEVDFWGGDLRGLTDKLDYIKSLGINVVYLNPIFLAFTNHKYDTIDYFTIDPQYGSLADFQRLCDEAHRRGLRVVLDGVFNHTGKRAHWFQAALKDSASPYRDFYTFGTNIKNGYLGWVNLANLPELNYNNPTVRDTIYRSPASVVQKYLAYADGWRLDVAFDLGPQVLAELTESAHQARPDSYTVGEIYNYPAGWSPALDGVMNMFLRRLLLEMMQGKISGPRASEMIAELIADGGIEPVLRSWIVLSNHDRPRLKNLLPDLKERSFLIALQVTLPGAPLVYYGEEIGLSGGEDPEQRGPMNWELANSGSVPEFKLTRTMLEIHNRHRALQVGDFQRISGEKLFAFARYTASVRETVVVVANPTNQPVTEIISPRDPWLMDVQRMRDLLSDTTVEVSAGLISVNVPAKTVQIFVPLIENGPNYTPYKRVE